jgi:hypothetical protein
MSLYLKKTPDTPLTFFETPSSGNPTKRFNTDKPVKRIVGKLASAIARGEILLNER